VRTSRQAAVFQHECGTRRPARVGKNRVLAAARCGSTPPHQLSHRQRSGRLLPFDNVSGGFGTSSSRSINLPGANLLPNLLRLNSADVEKMMVTGENAACDHRRKCLIFTRAGSHTAADSSSDGKSASNLHDVKTTLSSAAKPNRCLQREPQATKQQFGDFRQRPKSPYESTR